MGRKAFLARRKAVKEPARRFVVFCEGKNTEPEYLRALCRNLTKSPVLLDINSAVGVPLTIARKAGEAAKRLGIGRSARRRRDSFEEKDEVWVVFDEDVHPNLQQAINVCNGNKVGIAYSNPCFEVWLVLHYEDYDRPDGRKVLQRHCEKVCRGYDSKKGKIPDCRTLVLAVEQAERRAEKQLGERLKEGTKWGVPCTTVFKLTRAIRLG